jgi:hypothetical protein
VNILLSNVSSESESLGVLFKSLSSRVNELGSINSAIDE